MKPTPPDAPVQPVPPGRTTESGSLGGQRLGKILERTIEGTKLSGVAPGIDAGGAPNARPPSAVIAKTTPSPRLPRPIRAPSKGRHQTAPSITHRSPSKGRRQTAPSITHRHHPPRPAPCSPSRHRGRNGFSRQRTIKSKTLRPGANRWKRIFTPKQAGKIGLFKPSGGEVPIHERTGIKAGQRYPRAAAAAYLAEKAGIATPKVEMVVLTEAKRPDEVSSFQDWTTEGEAAATYFNSLSKSDYETRINKSQPKLDLDAFDWVIANMDRHPGNWRVVSTLEPGKVQKVLAIDMDVSLPPGPQRYSGSGAMATPSGGPPPPLAAGFTATWWI